MKPKEELRPYQSGGRNPNWEPTCGTCAYLAPDKQYSAHGWCQIHNNASVSITGGCNSHKTMTTEQIGTKQVQVDESGTAVGKHLSIHRQFMEDRMSIYEAAPDMLQVLEDIVRTHHLRDGRFEDAHIHPDMIVRARKVIRKARGIS